jgi:hypothetical protein
MTQLPRVVSQDVPLKMIGVMDGVARSGASVIRIIQYAQVLCVGKS